MTEGKLGRPQITSEEREDVGSRRDPEERSHADDDAVDVPRRNRERAHDKTLADSFPTSDPPSSIPDPCEDQDAA